MPDPPDAKNTGNRLVEAWQAAGSDREAVFREIFDTYKKSVYHFFAKRGFSPQECQDLVQDSFLKVHRGLPDFRGEARFETWLFQITANLYRNTLRFQGTQKREAKEVSLEEVVSQESEKQPAVLASKVGALEGVLSGERSRLLREALKDLPSQMRRCVELRVYRDLSYKEIAAEMQVSIDTVKAHLFQARQVLRGKLAPYFDDLDL